MAKPLPQWDVDVEDLREFSQISLIVADLDGTLVPSPLTKTIQELSRALTGYRYKVDFTLATGRTLAGVQPILSKLPVRSGMPLILYNGSVILSNGSFELLARRTISARRLQSILDLSARYGMRTFAYLYDHSIEGWFSSPTAEESVLGWSPNLDFSPEFNKMSVQWQDCSPSDDTRPSAVLIDVGEKADLAIMIKAQLREFGDITATRSGPRYIEIRPKGSNKGSALRRVAKKLNLSSDQILALGDNDNDAEMLAWAGIGVAIANASESALQNSDYVCRHGVFKGAIEVLRIIKSSKRYFFEHRKRAAG